MGRKRVAILVGQADEDYQSRFISGFLQSGFKHGFDTCIFSMFRKYQNSADREEGESSIFSLLNMEMFDAIVILKDTIQISGKTQEIEEKINKKFKGRVLVVEQESEYFPSICTDGYAGMKKVVEHLIKDHNYKDIAFLNGKRWHSHSIQRLQAFRDVMVENGRVRGKGENLSSEFSMVTSGIPVERLAWNSFFRETDTCRKQ